MRKQNANPSKAHIPYFAEKIPEYLDFIKASLLSKRGISSNLEQANNFQLRLKEHTDRIVKNKEVTYKWWLHFHLLISYIHDSPKLENIDLNKNIEELTERYNKRLPISITDMVRLFPGVIFVPTLRTRLGMMVFNRLSPLNIHPLSFERNNFTHDLEHATQIVEMNQTELSYRPFHDKLMNLLQDLSVKKRKSIEFAYFIFIHELYEIGSLIQLSSREKMKRRLFWEL